MIVIDASLVVALLSERDRNHAQARHWYESATHDLVTTPLALAEIDYFASAHAGPQARDAFRRDIAAGTYAAVWWPEAAAESVEVAHAYVDLGVSLTDGSLVALAAHVETVEVATFDERHFRAMRPLTGGTSFTLLPADA